MTASASTGDPRELAFRQILEHDAGIGGDAPAIAAAACRSYRHLVQHLMPLIGDTGAAAVYVRSLSQQRFPWLEPVVDSSPLDGLFARVQASLTQQEPDVATQAAVLVLTTVVTLLESFIGAGLTASLLRETWPGNFSGAPAAFDERPRALRRPQSDHRTVVPTRVSATESTVLLSGCPPYCCAFRNGSPSRCGDCFLAGRGESTVCCDAFAGE